MKTYILDSFTDQPFKGNPAGVCLVENDLSEEKMLLIAQELGLSETAFVKKLGEKDTYSIRYFSPVMEIPLCGHATLASAKVIFDASDSNTDTIQFMTHQKLELVVQKSGSQIIMEFPVYDTEPSTVSKSMLEALGISQVVNTVYNKETNILVLEMEDAQALQRLQPDFTALYKSSNSINGVLVTALSHDSEYDFYSRYFWPWSGTNEDPVTGGTHTFLSKYWGNKLNKSTLRSFQASKRTGFMELELLDNNKFLIKGKAVKILEGNMLV